jgi:hypothetical protein
MIRTFFIQKPMYERTRDILHHTIFVFPTGGSTSTLKKAGWGSSGLKTSQSLGKPQSFTLGNGDCPMVPPPWVKLARAVGGSI